LRTAASDVELGTDSHREVAIEIVAPAGVIDVATKAYRDGAAVLLIRSTVSDAVDTYLELQEAGVEALLHHSRYALHDRTLLDRLSETQARVHAGDRRLVDVGRIERGERGDEIAQRVVPPLCLFVAAEVVVPLQAVPARKGTKPTALIIDRVRRPTSTPRAGHVDDPDNWPWVYRNLLSSRPDHGFIRSRGRIIPSSATQRSDCRELVERATHVDHLRGIAEARGGRWPKLWRTVYGGAAVQEQLGDAVLVDWSNDYADAVINGGVATRLGGGKIDVTCPGLRSPFDGAAICLPVPARWLRDVADRTRWRGSRRRITLVASRLLR
jgi:hypothetical protein